MEVFLWILPILLSIPIGIVVNIYTPSAQNWLATRSQSRASKRISVLNSELETVNDFRSNTSKLYLKSASVVFNILFFLVIGSILSTLASFASFSAYFIGQIMGTIISGNLTAIITSLFIGFSIVPYLMAAIAALNHLRLISRVDHFEKYEQEIHSQIKQIEAKKPKQLETE